MRDRFMCEDCGGKVPNPCVCPWCGGTRWITLEDIPATPIGPDKPKPN